MLTHCGFKVSKQKELIGKIVNQTPTPLVVVGINEYAVAISPDNQKVKNSD